MLPLQRVCQTVGYACWEIIHLASLGKHRNSLQPRFRSRITIFQIDFCNFVSSFIFFTLST